MLFPLRSTGNNPLLARNDQRLFSPHNINMYSRDNVLRIDRMIMFLSFYKFSQFLIKKCREIGLENLYVDIRA